jgi:hypothetical protein
MYDVIYHLKLKTHCACTPECVVVCLGAARTHKLTSVNLDTSCARVHLAWVCDGGHCEAQSQAENCARAPT